MNFLPNPRDDATPLPGDPRARLLLFASALLAIAATLRPWISVRFARLFGQHDGPPAWHSTAGFTCFSASALILVLTLTESDTAAARRAVRPASLFLAALLALLLLGHALRGPGTWRGVTAQWTWMFWIGAAAAAALAAVCAWRWRHGQRPRHSSSGPPT